MIRTHKALRSVQEHMGLGEVAFMSDCPESATTVQPAVVSIAA
jgi:hypothetical protein